MRTDPGLSPNQYSATSEQVELEESARLIAEMRDAIEHQIQNEQEIERIADERRQMIADHGIDSPLQRMMDVGR